MPHGEFMEAVLPGTVQAFVPNEFVEEFRVGMEKLFGQGSCTVMQVRSSGAVMVF